MAICQNDSVYLDASGIAVLIPSNLDGGSTDNCGIASISTNPSQVDCSAKDHFSLLHPGGTSYIDATGVNVTNLSFSVECWVSRSGFQNANDFFQLGSQNQTNKRIRLGFLQDKIFFSFRSNDLQSDTAISTPGWHHYAFTYDAATNIRIIYLDGTEVKRDTSVSDFIGNTNVRIGFSSGALFGEMDDLRVWDHVRSPAQINANKDVHLTGAESGLLAYWTFNDGPGSTTVADYSGNGHTGTMVNLDPITSFTDPAPIPPPPVTVQLIVEDLAGNKDSCAAYVLVFDTIPPTAICRDTSLYLDGSGNATLDPAMVDNGSFENCGSISLSLNQSAFACADTGTTAVTLTIADITGTSDNCISNVTVYDTVPPVVVCPNDTTVWADSSLCSLPYFYTAPQSSDNCGFSPYTGTFMPGDTFPVGTTPITLTLTDISGNTDQCTFNVTVVPRPLALSMSAPTLSCGYHLTCAASADGSVTAQPIGGCEPYTYNWSNGQSSPVATGLSAGWVSLTVTDGNGATATDSLLLTAPPAMLIDSIVSPVSGGYNVTCSGYMDGSIDLTWHGGGGCGGNTYSWSGPQGYSANYEDPILLNEGTYVVTITDGQGCTLVDSITLTSPPAINLQLTVTDESCLTADDGAVTATLSGGVGSVSLLWSTGDTTLVIDSLNGGTYWVVATDQNGCQKTDTVTVNTIPVSGTVLETPLTTNLCQGDTVILSGGPGFSQYAWSSGQSSQSIAVTGGGTFILTVTDAQGCEGYDTVTINYYNVPGPNPIISPATGHLCDPDSLLLNAGSGYASYLWSGGQSTQTILISQAGSYSVTVHNGLGCIGVSNAVQITASSPPATPTITISGDTLYSSPAYDYQWNFNGLPIPGETNMWFVPGALGSYTVTVYDSMGCGTESAPFLLTTLEASFAQDLRIWPVPAQDALHIAAADLSGAHIGLRDLTGRLLREARASANIHTLSVTGLPAGMYLLELEKDRGRRVRTVIIR